MEDQLTRAWESLAGRLSGPLWFRFVLQPIAVTLIGIVAGMRDARQGQPLYFWAILGDSTQRKARLREAWAHLARVAAVILIVDYIYQVIVFRWLYPAEGFLIAVLVALVPYVLARGLANRIGRHWVRRAGAST